MICMLFVLIALAVGIVIGATERTAVINAVHGVEKRIHDRLAKLEAAVKEKL